MKRTARENAIIDLWTYFWGAVIIGASVLGGIFLPGWTA